MRLDSHCENGDPSLLQLRGKRCGTFTGLSIRNDEQDLRDGRVSATREALAENAFQSLFDIFFPISREKRDKIGKAEIELFLSLLLISTFLTSGREELH